MTSGTSKVAMTAGIVLALTGSGAYAQDEKAADCPVGEFTMALRFQQQSAEIQALQRQAYNVATEKLDAAVQGAADPAKLAVVMDLDETVIDNSALLARDLAECHVYDSWDTWLPWEREGKPTLIPGAKEFLDHADGLGVAIRYVSDRADEQKDHTLTTLKELELPQATDESVLLLGPTKVERRQIVSEDHEIVLLLGDTLADFDGGFKNTPLDDQKALVTENASKWGAEWIVFPNASYGSWSTAPLTKWESELVIEEW